MRTTHQLQEGQTVPPPPKQKRHARRRDRHEAKQEARQWVGYQLQGMMQQKD